MRTLASLLLLLTACDRPPITAEDLAAAREGGGGGEGGGGADADGLTDSCEDQERPTAQTFTTDERVETLLATMTLAEKVDQMAGFEAGAELFATPDNERLGVRGIKFRDGPRGVRLEEGTATAFPVAVSRGASFDRDLERRVGAAMAREVRGLGHHLLLAPTINTLRHPGWGRAQETYGEDPFHLGIMGAVFTQGVQGEGVPACVKHLAGNNLEDTRMTNNAVIDEQNLRENYLRQFAIALRESDPACVMSAYNKVNGLYCSENQHLLREVLKDEWGFDGFVVSDWFAARSTIESALAGLDIEMPFRDHYARLESAVDSGQVPISVIDDAVRRILRIKFKFGFGDLAQPWEGDPDVVEGDEHLALAKEAAVKGAVLLKNAGDVLPLERSTVGRIAVMGVWSDQARLGDNGSSKVIPAFAVTPFEGIASVAGDGVDVVQSNDASAAAGADVAIIVGALTAQDEGEAVFGGGDREVLTLSPGHEALIDEVAATVETVIVVLEAGGPITMAAWLHKVDAVATAWYPGQLGGEAIGELLFGDESFSGRLPQTWPKALEDEPEFGNKQAETAYAYLHGYRHFVGNGIEPLFPFGHGLTYTSFEYRALELSCAEITAGARLTARVTVANTGDRPGAEVVQLYATFPADGARRIPIQLAGFDKVELAPGEETTVSIPVWISDLGYYDEAGGSWVVAPGEHTLHAGPSVADLPLSQPFDVSSEGRSSPAGGGAGPDEPPDQPDGPAQVTFQVDMAGFVPALGVFVQGSFNDQCGRCDALADPDGDGVWRLTRPVEAGEHTYRFTTDGWSGLVEEVPAECADDAGLRSLVVGAGDVELPAHYFGRCAGGQGTPPLAQGLSFMISADDVPGDELFVQADWNGWCATCQPLEGPDGAFHGSFVVPPGTRRYRLATGPDGAEMEPLAAGCTSEGGYEVEVLDQPVGIVRAWGECPP